MCDRSEVTAVRELLNDALAKLTTVNATITEVIIALRDIDAAELDSVIAKCEAIRTTTTLPT